MQTVTAQLGKLDDHPLARVTVTVMMARRARPSLAGCHCPDAGPGRPQRCLRLRSRGQCQSRQTGGLCGIQAQERTSGRFRVELGPVTAPPGQVVINLKLECFSGTLPYVYLK